MEAQKLKFGFNQNAYLKNLKFGSVRDKFLSVRDSPLTTTRVSRAMIVVPVIVGGLLGTQHFVRESFVMYLKY